MGALMDEENLVDKMMESFGAVRGIVLDIENAREFLLNHQVTGNAEAQLFSLAVIAKNRIESFSELFLEYVEMNTDEGDSPDFYPPDDFGL
jgi:hypothetical protein